MSKYQEALEEIAEVLVQCGRTISAPGDTIMEDERILLVLKELVDKHEKIKKVLNEVISERINKNGKVLEKEEITYIQALQFVLKLLEMSKND